MARSRKKIGEILLGWGLINQKQLDEGLAKAQSSGKRIGEALVELGFVKDDQIAKALAHQHGMEYVDLAAANMTGKVDGKLIPEELIKKHLILPLAKVSGRLQLVIHDPTDIEMQDLLRFRLNTELEPRLAAKSQIKWYIENKLNGAPGGVGPGGKPQKSLTEDIKMVEAGKSLVTESIDKSVDRSVDRSVDKSIDVAADDAPIVKLCTRMLVEAVKMRASDIHIEPMADRVRLRYRIDGVCMERDNLPKRMQNSVLSRMKLMAGMNIAEKRVPQDGRIKIHMDETQIDFRVSACPAYHGESIVLRILRPDSVKIGLVNLGFEEDNLAVFNRIIRRPNGIFLVTGPTGSGKTTTLYSALDVLNRPDRKIITAEDPIEYNFDGINQVQINEKIGLSFKEVLKSMLRQAPNIILVGEIRDREVGEIAIQAALTGHLVFSTLHTNDAPSSITRLIDMGIKPFLVASSIQAIMAQRLLRVLCKHCKAIDPNPDPKYLHLCGMTPDEARGKAHKNVGCDQCNNAGYRGRQAIFEMMLMNSEIREMAFNMAPIEQIRKAALAAGMRSLVQDGKIKILKGVTTPDEVARMAQVEGEAKK
ncbi:MAG: Flp pilus assembly complex ATPase component TadA [Phycisphaerales bacterium]|nr:Flp pilus assembly complex ATPase component TadA [Phycisphaerales bacterium]